jgi:MFS family permease
MRGLRNLPMRDNRPPPLGIGARIRSGLRHVRERQPAGTALLVVAATSVFGLGYIAQMPAVAARVSPDPSVFLLLTTLSAIGSGAGVALVALRSHATPSVIPAAVMLAVQGGVVLALGFTTTLWLAVALVTVGGAMMFGIMTSCNTIVQAVVDDDHRGRVMSLYVMCWGGLMPIGGLLVGVLWHLTGPEWALAANGLAALAVAGAVLRPSLAPERPDTQPA